MVHGFSMLQRLISIHSTTRVETEDRRNVNRECWISIHSTTRVETLKYKFIIICDIFQSTPPRGWRPWHDYTSCPANAISIHSTTRVETGLPNDHSGGQKFQSTPPRGWRRCWRKMRMGLKRFQSTPPRGWRPLSRHETHSGCEFQSTPPRGWRRWGALSLWFRIMISIHSTTRVETRCPLNHAYCLH